MCQDFGWIISVGSACGLKFVLYSLKIVAILIFVHSNASTIYIIGGNFKNRSHVQNHPPLEKAIQSVLWIGFGIAGALTYLCILPVTPYSNYDDFFRVTLVKLYFEGPQCIPDGSYLGKFNEKYRKLSLFTPDLVFSVMVANVILNAIYFILSFRLYLKRNNKDKRGLALSWSGMTLLLCVLDAFIAFRFLMDFFTLRLHMDDDETDTLQVVINAGRSVIREVPYISLILALVSIRFVAFWLWNFIIGFSLFFNALCCRKIIGTPKNEKPKEEKRVEVEEKPQQVPKKEESIQPKVDASTSISLLNGKYTSAFDVRSNPDYLDFKKSMEAVTRFSNVPDNASSYRENINRHWGYSPSEAYWHPAKSHTSKEWEMTNEGFVNDEPMPVDPDRQFDFDHNLKNFEPGQRKIKIVKPPIGKPVSIPVPPPLPTSGSCNC